MARQKTKICLSCSRLFRGRADAKTCSERCRKRLQRAKLVLEQETSSLKQSFANLAEAVEEKVDHLGEKLATDATEEGFIAMPTATPEPPVIPVAAPPPPQLVPTATEVPQPVVATPSPIPARPPIESLEAEPPAPGAASLPNLVQPIAPSAHQPGDVFTPTSEPELVISPDGTLGSTQPNAVAEVSEAPVVVPETDTAPTPTEDLAPQPRAVTPIEEGYLSAGPITATQGEWRNKFRLPHVRFNSTAWIVVAASFVIASVAVGTFLLGAKTVKTPSSLQPGAFNSDQALIPANPRDNSLHINRPTVFNSASTTALVVQNPSSSAVLVVDSINNKVGIDTIPSPTGASLQVKGDISVNGRVIVNGSALATTNLADGRSVTLMGNSFNGPSQLVQLTSSGLLPVLNGSNLTSVDAITLNGQAGSYYTNASNISSGTLSDSRLSSNVALLNANQDFSGNNNFSGDNTFTGVNNFNNASNSFTGVFSGDGSNLTNLNASNLSFGTVNDARLSSNVALLNANNTFSGNNTFNGITVQNGNFLFQSATNSLNAFQVQNAAGNDNLLIGDTINTRLGVGVATPNYTLDVGGDVNIAAGQSYRIGGVAVCSALGCTAAAGSGNYVQLQATTPGVAQSGHFNITGTAIAGTFSGSGIDLTNLDASQLALGTVNDVRLSPNVTLQGNTFNGASQLVQTTNVGYLPAINGSLLTNLDAGAITTGTLNDLRLSANVALLGASSQTFSGNNTFSNVITAPGLETTSAGHSVNIGFSGTASGNLTYDFDVAAAPGSYTICTTIGNCASSGGGVTTSGGTINRVAKFSGSQTLADSIISDNGTTVNVGGNLNATTITQNNNTVCDVSGNCAGVGGQVGTFGSPTPGTIALFHGSATIENSILTQSAGTVTAGGNFNVTGNYQVNGVQITSAVLSNDANLAKLDGNNTFTGFNTLTGNLLIQPTVDSNSIAVIKNHAGTTSLLVADTSNNRLGVKVQPSYTLDVGGDVDVTLGNVYRVNGVAVCSASGCTAAAGSGNYIQNSVAQQANANFNIQSTATGSVVGVLAGKSGQSADLLQAKDGSANIVLSVGSAGAILSKDFTSGSHTFFQIQNNSSQSLLTADTISGQILFPNATVASSAILIGGDANLYRSASSTLKTDGSFTIAGNANIGSSGSPANGVLTIGTNTTANSGGLYFGTDTNLYRSASGRLQTGGDFYAVNMVATAAIQASSVITSGSDITARSGGATAVKIGNISAVGGGASGISFQNNEAGSNLYRSASGTIKTDGNLVVATNLTANGNTLLQTTTNSTTAFQVQNSNGNNYIQVDTNGANLYLGNTSIASTIQIGNTSGAVAQTINIGNNATASSTNTVVIGSTIGTSPVTLQAGTSGVVVKPANTTTAFQIQNSTGTSLLTADTTNMNVIVNQASTGDTQAWQTDSHSMSQNMSGASTVVANGYVYAIGAANGGTTVSYATLQSSGSLSSWATTSSLPASLSAGAAVTANGYIYYIGGCVASSGCSSGVVSTVYYAKQNSDGTLGSWLTNANSLAVAKGFINAQIVNGYVYVMGGDNNGTAFSNVYYAQLNSDGSVGAFTSTTSLPGNRHHAASVVVNGTIYLLGGCSNNALGSPCNSSSVNTVYYSRPNSDGTISNWNTNSNNLPASINALSAAAASGYIYAMGGTISGNTNQSAVYYSKINTDGSLASFSTSINSLPNAVGGVDSPTGMAANGYIYLGNGNATGSSMLYYASLGSTQVQGITNLWQGLGVYGNTRIQSTTNSTNAFQVQNSTGTALLVADTTNFQVAVGKLQASSTIASVSGSATAQLGWNYVSSNVITESNVITDATRLTNTQGDGLTPPDSSTGIWEGTTNKLTNGGFESNTTNWNQVSSTLTRVTTQSKFGSASGQIVTSNSAANEGAYQPFTASANVYTVSAWVKAASGTVRLRLTDNTPTTTDTGSAVTMNGTWQRLTLTSAANLTAATYRVYVETNVQQNITFFVDGVQAEQKSYFTPYVETNGGTASRTASAVTAPLSLLNSTSTQGWVATRFSTGNGVTGSGPSAYLFAYGIDQDFSHSVDVRGVDLTTKMRFTLDLNNSAVTSIDLNGVTANQDITVVVAWTPTQLMLSVNGSAFNVVNTTGPNWTPTIFRIGDDIRGADSPLDGNLRWMATGTGTINNANASSLYSFGNTDPAMSALSSLGSGTANPTAVWNGVGTSLNGTSGTSQSALTLDDTSLYRSAANVLATNNAFLQQTTTNSTTAFQVQNASGSSIFNIDTTNGLVGTAATSTTSTNSQAFNLQTGNATGSTSNSGNLNLDAGTATGTAGTINIGVTNSPTINIGSVGSTSKNTTIHIADSSAGVQTITIGSTNSTSGVTIQAGTGDITFKGHVLSSQTTAPTIGTPSNCGSSPSAAVTAASTDTAGSFTITAGTGSPTTCDVIVTFNSTYTTAPKAVLITPTLSVGSATGQREADVSAVNATTFTVKLNPNLTGNTPAASEVMSYYYWVIK